MNDEQSDDYQTRRILLQCCSRLRIGNLASVEECRTLDVAEALETRLRTIDEEADGACGTSPEIHSPLPTGHPPSAAAGLPDSYEDLDRQIDAQVTAHKGYPTGTACYGAFSPNHSFEYASQKCYYCGITMTTLLEKLTSPVSPAQPVGAERGTPLTDQFLREPLAHRSIHEAWCDFARSLESRLHAAEAERGVLVEERERFVAYCQSIRLATGEVGPIQVARSLIEAQQDALASARQRIAELEKDERRLDWLEEWFLLKCEVEIKPNTHDGQRFTRNGHTLFVYEHSERGGEDETLRAAIDAATEKEREG